MNSVRIVLLGIGIFTAPFLLAQNVGTYWHQGTIHLVDGEHIEGMIQSNLEENYLLLRPNNSYVTKAYHARQVASYEIYDPVTRTHLTYYSLPHPTKLKKTYLFYKLLQEGELSLLSRESIRVQEHFTRQMHGAGLVYRPHLTTTGVEEFYVLNKKNKLIRFYGGKKELLKLMGEQAQKVEKLITTKRLHLHNTVHLKSIFRYYHSLQIASNWKHKALQEHAYYIQME